MLLLTLNQLLSQKLNISQMGRLKNTKTGVLFILAILLSASSVFAQNTITGTVQDAKGKGLDGATVKVVGLNKATTSDAKGHFELSNVKEDAKLVISMVGYKTIELRATKTMVIRLNEANSTMEEVVVTGFQRISKKNFTGSAVKLKASEIKTDGVVDVSRMLEGRAAGVAIQNVSSTFGSAPKVRVRGATSINGNNKPLWVVDGVVLEDIVDVSNEQLSSGDPTTLLGSSVAGINSNDIESIDILKDAAAAALYGARAMNGVIVITTKKGRVGKSVVSYTANFSSQLRPVYTDYNISNSAQQMSILGELERKGWLTSNILSGSNWGVYGKMYDLISQYDESNGSFGLANTVEARKAFLLNAANANTDWFKTLFRNSLAQEHTLSVSSGNDKTQSYFSTSFYSDNGWTIADKVKRYTLNFRNNYTLSDRFAVGFNVLGSVRQQQAPGTVNRTDNPVEGSYDRDFDINPFSFALNTSRAMTPYDENGNLQYYARNWAPFNIIDEVANNRLKINVVDLKLQGDMTYKISKNLRYEFVGALRYVRSTREHEITEYSNMANAYRAGADNATIREANKFLYRDPAFPDQQKQIVLPYGGFYNKAEDDLLNFDVRNSINFSKIYAEKHNVNILLGQQVKATNRQNSNNTGYGYQYDNGGQPFVDYRIIKQAIENNFLYYGMQKTYDRFASFYATSNYIYNNKYNFSATMRYDGSNQLGETRQSRWLPTWTLGGSWNVDGEPFMQNSKLIDYLTLRASYGLTASMGPATNSALVLKNLNATRPFLPEIETLIEISNLANKELTWEKLYTTNIGVDAGLFNRRVNLAVDFYWRKSFDLIDIVKTSGIGGELFKYANNADLKSNGVEVTLGVDIIKKKNFSWKSNFTFGYNNTKITRADNKPRIFDLVRAEGGNVVGYAANSLFSIDYQMLSDRTGVPSFIDERGDLSESVYLQDDSTQYLVYAGSVDPRFTGGFSNTFTYKGFTLNMLFTFQAGNKIRLYPSFKREYSDFDAQPKEFYDRWLMTQDETVTTIPSILDAYYTSAIYSGTDIYPYNNFNYSTQRVADGGFLRLKTVSLTYQLPQAIISKFKINNSSITVGANNPWLIYADKKLNGQDPEFYNAGGVAQPVQKQITVSLRLGL